MGTKKIHKRLNMPLTTLGATIKMFQTFGTVANLLGGGCKGVLSPRSVRRTKDHTLQTLVAFWGHKVSKSTIRRHLRTNRLFGRVARRKPLLRANSKFKHLEFAKRHWNYDWNRVLWSDETKMKLQPCTPLACLPSKEGCI